MDKVKQDNWRVVVTVMAETEQDAIEAVVDYLNAGNQPDEVYPAPDENELEQIPPSHIGGKFGTYRKGRKAVSRG